MREYTVSALMTVNNFSTQYNAEQFGLSPLLPPDDHHSSDGVY